MGKVCRGAYTSGTGRYRAIARTRGELSATVEVEQGSLSDREPRRG